MTLIESLKALAQKYPQKWFWSKIREMLVYRDMRGQACNPDFYSTEECDAILAEHGLVMWVSCHFGAWHGMFGTWDNPHGTAPYPTKREATEATFLAALEYIINHKEA
jgi:hypothetical protein